jgi:hypothetical protein
MAAFIFRVHFSRIYLFKSVSFITFPCLHLHIFCQSVKVRWNVVLQKTFSVTDETEFYLLLKSIMLIIKVLAINFGYK